MWEINGYKARFLYRITEVSLEGQKLSTLIDFMSLTEIINTAMHYTANEGITFSHIIGNSSCLKETIERSKIVAKSESTVLLQGESGTGKELFARAIHNASSRRNGPFIAINCQPYRKTYSNPNYLDMNAVPLQELVKAVKSEKWNWLIMAHYF